MIGIERPTAMGADQVFVDHGADLRVVNQGQFVDLVGGTETIKEVQEGHARSQGGRLGNQRHVMGFLHGG